MFALPQLRRWWPLAFAIVTLPIILRAQDPPPKLSSADIKAFAVVHLEISQVLDSADARLAQAKNKTADMQQRLREQLREQVSRVLQKHGLSDAEYQRRRYVMSTDNDARKEFDQVIAQLTGAPLPGQVARPAAIAVPAGEAGTHLGHVLNAFSDTPDGMGLLPAALAEARIAVQHAELASRNPSNLDALKLHAGHVIHALDPTIVTMGPGRGYGVKRAAAAVASHAELAAKAPGAPGAVTTHIVHVLAACKGAQARADQAIALARQVQSATSADAAAALIGQVLSIAQQIIAGVDANADGRITWDEKEGGLQQVQEHVGFMVR